MVGRLSEDLESRVSRLEETVRWIEKNLNDLSHKLDKKLDKTEGRLWFSVITILLIISQILIFFVR